MQTKSILTIMSIILASAWVSCSGNSKNVQTLDDEVTVEKEDQLVEPLAEDTTIHAMPYYTAHLEDAIAYFRANNKYKDWDKNDERRAFVKCIIEKDGTPTQIEIGGEGTGKPELDEEAIRLIKEGTISPALNEQGKPVRSKFIIAVLFPPK